MPARSPSPGPPQWTTVSVPLLLGVSVLTSLGAVLRSFEAGSWTALPDGSAPGGGFAPILRSGEPVARKRLSFPAPSPVFHRTKYTFDSFVVNGVDLARFGLGDERTSIGGESGGGDVPPFALFGDFDLSAELEGNETWIELLERRRDATHPSLSFYVDKVAFKRWLASSGPGAGVEGIPSLALAYADELLGESRGLSEALRKRLPETGDYVAKPTHLSCSGGVWLVHNDPSENTTHVGNGKKPMAVFEGSGDVRDTIAGDLAENLGRVQEKCGRTVRESYALRHVRPGIVVEERFTQPGGTHGHHKDGGRDDPGGRAAFFRGGMEFKVFTIWGRAWLTVWRPGTDGVRALFFRNGTSLAFDPPAKKRKQGAGREAPPRGDPEPLPDWIDWERVVSMGERLGRNKDMFRTDIFVGVGSGSRTLKSGGNTHGGAVRYVVSETEIHPTPLRGFEEVFEEAGRLWLAGYYLLHERHGLSVVPNTEVPPSFGGAVPLS
ncbi:unnamed protein product [Pseudo-nitzschia multistriata]|uniref:Uncharacterized protein n=1 Tax=Pseudo-nitzschia multistriata TaxID=183589 RepID=A0A448YU40_9STRA|nr:unnamed protein product [Pseudo-nitzschia multistriata]